MKKLLSLVIVPVLGVFYATAHDTSAIHQHDVAPALQPWPFKPERKGPVKAPEPLKQKLPVSGQGFWKFVAATNRPYRPTDVYIVFTAWNPGGIGALKLVNVADAP